MNDYLSAANIPQDNDYGQPDPDFMAGGSMPSGYRRLQDDEGQAERDADAQREAAREQRNSRSGSQSGEQTTTGGAGGAGDGGAGDAGEEGND